MSSRHAHHWQKDLCMRCRSHTSNSVSGTLAWWKTTTLGCILYFWLSAPDTTFSPVFIQKCIIKYMFLLTKVSKCFWNSVSVNDWNTRTVTLINSINSVVLQFVIGSVRICSGKDLVLSGALFLMVTYTTIASKQTRSPSKQTYHDLLRTSWTSFSYNSFHQTRT